MGGLYGHWIQKARQGELHPGCAALVLGGVHMDSASSASTKPGLLKPKISASPASTKPGQAALLRPMQQTKDHAAAPAALSACSAEATQMPAWLSEPFGGKGLTAASANGSGNGCGGDAWAA